MRIMRETDSKDEEPVSNIETRGKKAKKKKKKKPSIILLVMKVDNLTLIKFMLILITPPS
jgi:hypothetical protein